MTAQTTQSSDIARTEPAHAVRLPYRVLCLDGGGYLGLGTAAFIESTERHFKRCFSEQFDMFVGTSTGGIIALALACGMTGSDLVGLYRRLGRDVFRNRWQLQRQVRALVPGLWRSRYTNEPLRAALNEVFGEKTLGYVLDRKKCVVVPAYNVTVGAPCVFKTDHADSLSRDGRLRVVDVAMATSAAPTYLPIVSIDMPDGSKQLFVDGGVFANNPALLGIAEARSTLGVPADRLSVLSVSPPKHRAHGRRPYFGLRRGIAGWILPLSELFVSSATDIGHQVSLRLHRDYERVALTGSSELVLDRTDEFATDTLIALGAAAANDNMTRTRLARFFTDWRSNGQYSETA